MSDKNDCKDRHEAIAALVLEELDPAAANEIKSHIDTCANCRSLYQALAAEEQTIRSTFDAIKDRSKAMEDELVAQIDEDLHKPSSTPTILGRIWGARTKWRIGELAAAVSFGSGSGTDPHVFKVSHGRSVDSSVKLSSVSRACAAARRAMGTRGAEQET